MRGAHPSSDVPWEVLENIGTYHQQHERFYTAHELKVATELQHDANVLKMLADAWRASASDSSSVTSDVDYSDPRNRVVGCADLNAVRAIASTGVLFMEGEDEPREIRLLRSKVRRYADSYDHFAAWLQEKMQAAWERERTIVESGLSDAILPRYMALIGTTHSANQMRLAADLLSTVRDGLEAMSFKPADLRRDLQAAADQLRALGWLIDQAVQAIADQGLRYGQSDPWWSKYREVIADYRKNMGQ